MSLTHARLRAVNAVVEEGSFSAAARRLGMSQPAVSQAIKKLEEGFGLKLFESRGRYLVPTEYCLELAQITDQMQKLEDEAHLLLQRGDALESGAIKIGLGNSMPGMALIGKFKKQFPKISIDVRFGNYSSVVESVIARTVDVGILPNIPVERRFYRQICLQQKVVAIVHPEHNFARSSNVSLATLARYPLIFRSRGSSTQQVVDQGFKAVGLHVEPSFILESRDGVCEAVANGLGVGFMWDQGSSRTNGIVRLHVNELSQSYDEVVFRLTDTENKIVDAFFLSTAQRSLLT